MCGIAGIAFKKNPSELGISKKEIERFVDGLLLGIEQRGPHATGVLSARDGLVRLDKKPIEASRFIFKRKGLIHNPRVILLHTRFATQGDPVFSENNHPVEYDDVYAVHNGHISNDSELFKSEKLERRAEVDSSIIPALVSKYGLDKVNVALGKLLGGFATAIYDTRRPNTLVLAKGDNSPCVVFENDNVLVWASTSSALDEGFAQVYGKKGRPASSALTHLNRGDLLLFEDGNVEKLSFKVKDRPKPVYSPPPKGAYTGAPAGSKEWPRSPGWFATTDECKCTHTSLHHEGMKGDGACYKNGCKCKAMKLAESKNPVPKDGVAYYADQQADGSTIVEQIDANGTRTVYGMCDGCYTAFNKDELTRMSGYDLCGGCWGEDGKVPTPAKSLVQRMLGCDVEEDQKGELIEPEVVVMGPTEPKAHPLKALPGGKQDLTPNELRDRVFARIEDATGCNESVVEWLLFDEDAQLLLPTQPTLQEQRNELETMYLKFEEEVKAECGMTESGDSCGVTVFEDDTRQIAAVETVSG